MMKNKKGMSAVVTTLIIILLVIVALGIIWVVVKNVIKSGVEQVDLSSKCRDIEIEVLALENTTNQHSADAGKGYNLTLKRTGAGSGEEMDGVKLVFFNDEMNGEPVDWAYALAPLETHRQEARLDDLPVPNATKVEVTVYFISDLGETDLCPTTIEEEF
jgi:hypothetical protein